MKENGYSWKRERDITGCFRHVPFILFYFLVLLLGAEKNTLNLVRNLLLWVVCDEFVAGRIIPEEGEIGTISK